MRILLIGHVSGAMLILSTLDNIIVNFYSMCRFANEMDDIDHYVSMCCPQINSDVTQVYNDSPWSNMLCSSGSVQLKRTKERLYELCGWMPDVIVHLYGDAHQSSVAVTSAMEAIFNALATDPIPIYSLDLLDRNYENNLIALFRHIKLEREILKK